MCEKKQLNTKNFINSFIDNLLEKSINDTEVALI